MAVDFLPQSSLFIGIIPALALIYLVMRKWTKDFKEKTVFIMFVIGIVSGFITVFLELYVNLVNQVEIILLFRLIQLMIITMVLNLPRLQGKQETVLYGLVLGLGVGSIYPPVSLLLISAESVILTDVISILLGALGLMLLHGATGTLIGYSIFKRKLFQIFVISLILQFIVQYLFFNLPLAWMWTLSIVGLIVYLVLQKMILYGVMEQSVRKKPK
ncbi:MAG: protease PrsW [Candidatus Thermoplasmatota archaeon]|nr:protease PrsW [Candidatus Thermoplasmatota archaeon]